MKKIIIAVVVFYILILKAHAQNANTSLSNLTNTSIDSSLVPKTNAFINLGSSTHGWKNIYYTGTMYLDNTKFLTTTSTNTFVGKRSGNYNTNGTYNTALGDSTLLYNSYGFKNVAIGNNALENNTSGYENTAIGMAALANSHEDIYELAIGDSAMFTQNASESAENTAIGTKSLFSNTSGYNLTATGFYSLYKNTTGIYNTAHGTNCLFSNTTGSFNTAVGAISLNNNTTGYGNSTYGANSMVDNTTGNYNTAAGVYSLFSNATGTGNTAMGYNSLTNSYSSANTAIGYVSLATVTTGSANTAVGYGTDINNGTLTNTTAIGYDAYVNASNKVVVGNTSVTVIGGQVGWSVLSDGRFKTNIKENVPGLAFINKLKPVTFNVDAEKYAKFIGVKDSLISVEKDSYAKTKQKIRTGFVAQEVEKSAKEINYDFDGLNAPQNEKDNYSLVYSDFIPSIVKAVQELSKKVDNKDSIIDDLQQQVAELKSAILSTNHSNIITSSDNQQAMITSYESLSQNMPNPYTNSTIIKYSLPKKYASAKIIVSDKSGKLMRQQNVSGKGRSSIIFNASTLASGTYQYILIVDGKQIGSKQMMVIK